MHCVLSHFSGVWLFAALWTVGSLAGSSVGILQARVLEWVAMFSSRGSSGPEIEPTPPAMQVDSLPLSLWESP